MPVVAELQMLNKVLETKDWRYVTENHLNIEHFPIHSRVFTYLESFLKQYGDLPTLDTVLNTFEEFERIEVESIPKVVDSLREDLQHRMFTPILKQAAQLVAEQKTSDAMALVKEETTQLIKATRVGTKGYSYVGQAQARKEKYLSIHGRTEDQIIGATTGFYELDQATNGIISGGEETDYFLVFAPSNMGKSLMTSFMLASAWDVSAIDDYPAYFALEQHASEISRTWDNMFAGVSSLAMQRGTMTPEQRDKYIDYLDQLQKKKKDMMIYDTAANGGKPYTVTDIQRILETEGHNRFALDQLSKVRLSNNSMGSKDLRQRLFDTSAEVREMILATGKGGYVLAQANRESARRVKKSGAEGTIEGEDVGEAYSIYQDASKGISIIKMDENTFKIQVIKNRGNGSGQNFLVRYNWNMGLVSTLSAETTEQFF